MINYITDLGGHRFPNSPRYEKPVTGPTILKSQAKAGDVVLANTAGKKIFCTPELYEESWKDNDEYTAIAKVVVPASHTNDGSVKCTSMLASYTKFHFANAIVNYSTILDALDSNSKYVVDSHYSFVMPGTTTISKSLSFAAPRGITSAGVLMLLDPFATEVRQTPAVSPYYGLDEQKSPYFYLTQLGVSDLDEKTLIENQMDGKGATKYMHDVLKEAYYKDHPNGTDDSFYDVVSTATGYICNYHTVGTKAGDWYIPSPGELLYAISRETTLAGTMFSFIIKQNAMVLGSYFIKGSNNDVCSKYMHNGYGISMQELRGNGCYIAPFISI